MNAAELFAVLRETTVAISVGVLLVLLLRAPLRRGFGPAVGYAAWWLPLLALVAVLLPARTLPAVAVSTTASVAAAPAVVGEVTGEFDYATWACVIWLIGALACAAWMAWRQHAFVRRLGMLTRTGDRCCRASVVAGLPATLGLWRPRIVLPADFDHRYSDEQCRLMLAHERAHIAHGDLAVNAAVVLLRCVFWFNPLLHYAARCLRHDQELLCDMRVLARHPHSRRAYGEAMFHTQMAMQASPLGCHWGYAHPLKERIQMLKQPVPTFSRWLGGGVLVATLGLGFACAVWAAQPARAGEPAVDVQADQLADVATRTPPPRYPKDAVEQGIDGNVVLLVDVDARGRATNVEVESAQPAGVFEQAAIDAARQWTYAPKIENGKAVPGRVRVPIQFESDIAAGSSFKPPVYPAEAIKQHVTGRVVLIVSIDKDGNPTNVEVEQSEPAGVFDTAAIEAAMQWKFNPAVEDGQRVPSRVRVPVDFEIPPGEGDATAASRK